VGDGGTGVGDGGTGVGDGGIGVGVGGTGVAVGGTGVAVGVAIGLHAPTNTTNNSAKTHRYNALR
jgi:hypothetical protein